MERKLELKDIAGYLPYGLFCDTKLLSGMYCNEVFGVLEDSIYIKYREHSVNPLLRMVKPLLRPLSDMYRTIPHNGKDIVPIIELAKIHNSKDNWVLENKCAFGKSYFFSFCGTGFSVFNFTQSFPISNQYQLFDYLNELKIDYRGLIDAGLAVSVYDLEINPYK